MILVYTESEEGKFKKVALEAVSYAKGIADKMGTSVTAISINANDTSELAAYGASKVLEVSNEKLNKFNGEAYADAIAQAAKNEDAKVIVLTSSANSKFLAPTLAVDLNAGFVPNVVALPESTSPFKVKHSVFTNKAFAHPENTAEVNIVRLGKTTFGLKNSHTAMPND